MLGRGLREGYKEVKVLDHGWCGVWVGLGKSLKPWTTTEGPRTLDFGIQWYVPQGETSQELICCGIQWDTRQGRFTLSESGRRGGVGYVDVYPHLALVLGYSDPEISGRYIHTGQWQHWYGLQPHGKGIYYHTQTHFVMVCSGIIHEVVTSVGC